MLRNFWRTTSNGAEHITVVTLAKKFRQNVFFSSEKWVRKKSMDCCYSLKQDTLLKNIYLYYYHFEESCFIEDKIVLDITVQERKLVEGSKTEKLEMRKRETFDHWNEKTLHRRCHRKVFFKYVFGDY